MVQCTFCGLLKTLNQNQNLILYDKQQWRVTVGGLDLAVLTKSSWREGTRQVGELTQVSG